jgi:acetyl esterase/lipase
LRIAILAGIDRLVMRPLKILVSTILLAAMPAASQVPVSPTGVTEDRLPQPAVLLGKVRVLGDVVYAQPMGHRPLRLDLYQPPAGKPRPLVVFVHGGGWTTGHKRATAHFADFPGLLADLAQRGFVVASVEYRLSAEQAFPGAVDDVKAAIAFLRGNAGRYGIDAGKVAVWGGSAGAHLAAMAAYDGAGVQGFVGWYGPYAIDPLLQQSLAASKAGVPMTAQAKAETEGGLSFFGCALTGCPDGVAQRGSPIAHVDSGDPPALLVHGSADTLVPASQSEAMAAALRAAGVPVQLELVAGANHGWTSPTPEATTAASRRAVQLTFDWLQQRFAQ